MDYKIELFRSFRYRDKGRIKQVAPGTYSVPDDISDAAGRLAVEQGVAKTIPQLVVAYPAASEFTMSGVIVGDDGTLLDGGKQKAKRKYTRKKPAPSNKLRNVPENKSALASG